MESVYDDVNNTSYPYGHDVVYTDSPEVPNINISVIESSCDTVMTEVFHDSTEDTDHGHNVVSSDVAPETEKNVVEPTCDSDVHVSCGNTPNLTCRNFVNTNNQVNQHNVPFINISTDSGSGSRNCNKSADGSISGCTGRNNIKKTPQNILNSKMIQSSLSILHFL